MSNMSKIKSLEFGRTFAMLAIIALHCLPTNIPHESEPWFMYLFNQSTRFAVPLFFLISGYLIQPKLSAAPWETFKRYSLPLFRIWVVWSVLSLLLPFNFQVVMQNGYLAERTGYWNYLAMNPLNSLLEGGLVHLWFIPALIIAIGILAALKSNNLIRWALPLSGALFIYGILAGSYANVTEFVAPFFTRNGPFFSTLFVAVGYFIRERNIRCGAKTAALVMILGMVIHFSEAYILHQYGQMFNYNDYLFGTSLWGVGLFLLLLAKPNWGSARWIQSFASSALGIYVAHLLVAIVIMNIVGILGLGTVSNYLTVYVLTTFLTLLLVKGLERTPQRKVLLR